MERSEIRELARQAIRVKANRNKTRIALRSIQATETKTASQI